MFKPSEEWLHDYVIESNKIDPQPGHKNKPGDAHYDDHMSALKQVIQDGNRGRLSQPMKVHNMLARYLRGLEHEAGHLRMCGVMVGGRTCPRPERLAHLMRQWEESTKIAILEGGNQYEPPEEKEKLVWQIHVDYEHIHPHVDGNGRTGRLLMVNHAILLGLEPWIVRYDERMDYYRRF